MPTTSPGAVSGGAVGEAGDAEVHQLGPRLPVLGDLHVLRLDVAVDDAARVGVVERLAEVGADLADLAVAERAVVGEPGQGRALDQLGDEQGVAVLLAHLVEGDDAGVVEPRRRLGLAQHPPPGLAALLDRLDRDRALEAAVPGLVDDAEAAAADAALDQEAVEYEGTDQSSYFAGALLRRWEIRIAAAYARRRFILSAQPTSLESHSWRIPSSRAAPSRAPAKPSPRTPADHAAARPRARRRPDRS